MKRTAEFTPAPRLKRQSHRLGFGTPVEGLAEPEGLGTPDTVGPSQQPFPYTAERLLGGFRLSSTPHGEDTPKLCGAGASKHVVTAGIPSRLAAASQCTETPAPGAAQPALIDFLDALLNDSQQPPQQEPDTACRGKQQDGADEEQEPFGSEQGSGPSSRGRPSVGGSPLDWLHCSQHYTRVSQHQQQQEQHKEDSYNTPTPQCSLEASMNDPSMLSGGDASNDSAGPGPSSVAAAALLQGTQISLLVTVQAATSQCSHPQRPANSGLTPNDGHMTPPPGIGAEAFTPELGQVGVGPSQDPDGGSNGKAGDGEAASAVSPPALFPMFRSKNDRKLVILLRHGQSEFNARDFHGKMLRDPMCFDAALTDKGRQQCRAARAGLQAALAEHMGRYGAPLWVVSPLTRAMQTFLLACPNVPPGAAWAQPDLLQGLNVVVHPLVTERCYTVGDVGRPASMLAADFPCLSRCLSTMKERWWYNADGEVKRPPNCAQRQVLKATESKREMDARVRRFDSWLLRRSERLIVVVGHSLFHKQFMNAGGSSGAARCLQNCELHVMYK